MSGARPGSTASDAGLENRVNLRAILHHFPGALEARRHQECLSGPEGTALTTRALQHYPPGRHHAQLVFTVTDPPLTARGRPAPAEELLARVGEEVTHFEPRSPGQQPICGGFGYFRVHNAVESHDGGSVHCRAAQMVMPGNSSANVRRGPHPRRTFNAQAREASHGWQPGR